MSAKSASQKVDSKSGRKQKKRPATSPLNEDTSTKTAASARASGNATRGQSQSTSGNTCISSDGQQQIFDQTLSSLHYGTFVPPIMSFGQPNQPPLFAGYPGTQGQTQYPGQVISPGYGATSMIGNQGSTPPTWATELLDDVKQIKNAMKKIESIEKTVNIINMKVSDLEVKVNRVESRVGEVEKSCSFLSDQVDTHSSEVVDLKSDLNQLHRSCKTCETNVRRLEEDKTSMESKLTELECRSMRENLIFYGITEDPDENCETLVKGFCKEKLGLETAETLTFDRAHRLGSEQQQKPRPVIVKFHYYRERELVRGKSFDKNINDALKLAKMGVGVQWPKHVKEARKELRPIMLKEKERGKSVRFVRDKLYVNDRLVDLTTWRDDTGHGGRADSRH